MRIILNCRAEVSDRALMVANTYINKYPDNKTGISVFSSGNPNEVKFFFRRTKTGVSVTEFK